MAVKQKHSSCKMEREEVSSWTEKSEGNESASVLGEVTPNMPLGHRDVSRPPQRLPGLKRSAYTGRRPPPADGAIFARDLSVFHVITKPDESTTKS